MNYQRITLHSWSIQFHPPVDYALLFLFFLLTTSTALSEAASLFVFCLVPTIKIVKSVMKETCIRTCVNTIICSNCEYKIVNR